MESDKLIEAMARAMADNLGIRSWEDTPVDRGDLRRRIRDRENYDVNEPNQWDYLDAATAALKALRDTLEPVGYALHYSRNPEHNEIEYALPGREALTEADKAAGWFSTPLYSLPDVRCRTSWQSARTTSVKGAESMSS